MKELRKYVLLMVLAGYAGFVPAQVMADEPEVAASDKAPVMSAEEVMMSVASVYKETNADWAAKLEAMASGKAPMDATVLNAVAADLTAQGKIDWATRVTMIVKDWEAKKA